MHVQFERLHLQDILSHKSFAQCFIRKKNRKHFHFYTAFDYINLKREQNAFLCYKKVLVDDKKTIFHKYDYKSKISFGKCRSSWQNKLKSSFAGRQTFRMYVCNDRVVMWMCNVSHTYHVRIVLTDHRLLCPLLWSYAA